MALASYIGGACWRVFSGISEAFTAQMETNQRATVRESIPNLVPIGGGNMRREEVNHKIESEKKP